MQTNTEGEMGEVSCQRQYLQAGARIQTTNPVKRRSALPAELLLPLNTQTESPGRRIILVPGSVQGTVLSGLRECHVIR